MLIDHHRHHLPNVRLGHGDHVGEFAILGDTDWGSSLAIGVEDVEIEIVATRCAKESPI